MKTFPEIITGEGSGAPDPTRSVWGDFSARVSLSGKPHDPDAIILPPFDGRCALSHLLWTLKYRSQNSLSLRKFVASFPENYAPSFPTLSRMIKRSDAGEGFGWNKEQGLTPGQQAHLCFLSFQHKKNIESERTIAELARLAMHGTDEEIFKASDNRFLKVRDLRIKYAVIQRQAPGKIVRLTDREYGICKSFLEKYLAGRIWLSDATKLELKKLYVKFGCGTKETTAVVSIDETVIRDTFVDFEEGKDPEDFARIITVVQEGECRQFLSCHLIFGHPHTSEYIQAVWHGMHNTQGLTTLDHNRFDLIISDNTSAASEAYHDFCGEWGVQHRWAHPALPHAKLAVESGNRIIHHRGIPSYKNPKYVSYLPKGGPKVECTAQNIFDAVLLACYEDNRERRKGATYNRTIESHIRFLMNRLPMDRDRLPMPQPIFSERIRVEDNLIVTSDGAEFQVSDERFAENGRYFARRSFKAGEEQINFCTDDGSFTAIQTKPGGMLS